MARMAASDLFIIRHAESEWNALGRWQGRADVPLSPTGHEQARTLGESIAAWTRHHHAPVTHLLTSPQVRAVQTARELAPALGLEVKVEHLLAELDVGSWEGRSRDEIAAEDPEALDRFFRGEQGWNGGESYEQHTARATRFAQLINALPDDSRVVAITHGGTLRAVLLAMLELDPSHRWRLGGSANTAVTQLARSPHGWRMLTFNVLIGGVAPVGTASDLGAGGEGGESPTR